MSLITAVVTACLIGFLSPFVAVVSHTWVEKIRQGSRIQTAPG